MPPDRSAAGLHAAEPVRLARVPEPRRPAKAARDRACRRPSFSWQRARAPRAQACRRHGGAGAVGGCDGAAVLHRAQACRRHGGGGEGGMTTASSPRQRACAPAVCASSLHPQDNRRSTGRSCAARRPWVRTLPRIRARRSFWRWPFPAFPQGAGLLRRDGRQDPGGGFSIWSTPQNEIADLRICGNEDWAGRSKTAAGQPRPRRRRRRGRPNTGRKGGGRLPDFRRAALCS